VSRLEITVTLRLLLTRKLNNRERSTTLAGKPNRNFYPPSSVGLNSLSRFLRRPLWNAIGVIPRQDRSVRWRGFLTKTNSEQLP
jgi:hypothetical protein